MADIATIIQHFVTFRTWDVKDKSICEIQTSFDDVNPCGIPTLTLPQEQ
jgi:hypothetical protein